MKKYKYTNNLIDETSPYLHAHAHQPINWYTWGEEALLKAKTENKLLFISVGYSACHWCHMMSKDCFENETIASVLNEHYVSIKIDREERPDLDQIYLNAVQLMTDNAGWPLNCFALSDGSPVFGGTYFSSNQFLDIIQSLQDTYYNQFDKVKEVANDLFDALKAIDVLTQKEPFQKITENDLKLIIEPWKRKFDDINGGTQNPPKFPLPNGEEFLMWAAYYLDDDVLKNHLAVTLNKMMQGAIYDQIGGGFFRYTIDTEWRVPHFEKMLYDNVQLISLYAKAYQSAKNEEYKRIADETCSFLLREMYSPNGAFYSSIDSDNKEGEGIYYKWSVQGFKDILQDDAALAADYYGVTSVKNCSTPCTIYVNATTDELALKYSISNNDVRRKIKEIRSKLFIARNKRSHPWVDEKILASWNGMAIIALLDAYTAFNNEDYLHLAKKTARYIKKVLINDDGSIYRCITSKSPINGFLDDYAFVINAFILLYQITFDEQYINDAKKLTDYVIKYFYDDKSGMFFFTSNEEIHALGRKMDFIDRAVPSSASSMAQNFLLLAHICNDLTYYEYAYQMVVNMQPQMPGAGPFVANWAKLLFYFAFEPIIVKINTTNTNAIQLLRERFLPNVIIVPAMGNNGVEDNHLSAFNHFIIDDNTKLSDINELCKFAIENKRNDKI